MRKTPEKIRNVDLKAIAHKAMKQYGFETKFPPAMVAQVNNLDSSMPEKAAQGIIDLRDLLWSSIDNSDTMDFDQVEYCEQGQDGEIFVKVAVADVDAYVPKGSAADIYASNNTTSVYTGIEVFPMLPDRLSKGLSSLAPGEDRLVVVIEFAVQPAGDVRVGKVYRALIRNKAKLVYEEVGDWLEGKGKMPEIVKSLNGLEAQLKLQNKASLRLEAYRIGRGALELETLEARAIIQDENVLGFIVVRANRARHIIENFMVAANGVMSRFLEGENIPTIQRVVRIPKDWSGIVGLAKSRGAILPDIPNAKALAIFLAKQRKADPEGFPDLSLTVVKLLGHGEYIMYDKGDPIGHFCLAVTSYTHATAPNRRYVDLVIQRILKAALKNVRSPYGKKELSEIAAWCTEMEIASKKAERFMVKAEGAVLLAGKIGQEFDAIVTGASHKGVYARLVDPPVEGKMARWTKGLRVGQKVRVELVGLDPEKGFIDFEQVV